MMQSPAVLQELYSSSRHHFVRLQSRSTKAPMSGVSWKVKPDYKDLREFRGPLGILPGGSNLLVLDIDRAHHLPPEFVKGSTPHRLFTCQLIDTGIRAHLRRHRIHPIWISSSSGYPYCHLYLPLSPAFAQNLRTDNLSGNCKIHIHGDAVGDTRMDSGYVALPKDVPFGFFPALRSPPKKQILRMPIQMRGIKALLDPINKSKSSNQHQQQQQSPSSLPSLPSQGFGRPLKGKYVSDYEKDPFRYYYRDYLYAWKNGYSSSIIDHEIKRHFKKGFGPKDVVKVQAYIKANHRPEECSSRG